MIRRHNAPGRVADDSVIPIAANSRLFTAKPNSRTAIGIVAVGVQVTAGRDIEHDAYLHLRANVYAHERHFMPVEALNADGTETDEDDQRSIHFGLFENGAEGVRAVGALRLILKDDARPSALPIEAHYPSAFSEPVARPSAEVSRLITRHEDPEIQHRLKWPLFSAAVAWLLQNQVERTLGAVEPRLAERLMPTECR